MSLSLHLRHWEDCFKFLLAPDMSAHVGEPWGLEAPRATKGMSYDEDEQRDTLQILGPELGPSFKSFLVGEMAKAEWDRAVEDTDTV